jgi:hypothetical protein
MIIDTHAHVVPATMLDALRRAAAARIGEALPSIDGCLP